MANETEKDKFHHHNASYTAFTGKTEVECQLTETVQIKVVTFLFGQAEVIQDLRGVCTTRRPSTMAMKLFIAIARPVAKHIWIMLTGGQAPQK